MTPDGKGLRSLRPPGKDRAPLGPTTPSLATSASPLSTGRSVFPAVAPPPAAMLLPRSCPALDLAPGLSTTVPRRLPPAQRRTQAGDAAGAGQSLQDLVDSGTISGAQPRAVNWRLTCTDTCTRRSNGVSRRKNLGIRKTRCRRCGLSRERQHAGDRVSETLDAARRLTSRRGPPKRTQIGPCDRQRQPAAGQRPRRRARHGAGRLRQLPRSPSPTEPVSRTCVTGHLRADDDGSSRDAHLLGLAAAGAETAFGATGAVALTVAPDVRRKTSETHSKPVLVDGDADADSGCSAP